ncbi:MAG: DUF1573 domain-containing protein [Patescibacteria group bacterium]|nr:DUF1573 domain-containing protein [Patescibacteria group bacterium]MCL6096649.1 DUF1573 domain-containing protein [Patescibacteria group bacterium]
MNKKFIILIIFASILIMGGGIFLTSSSSTDIGVASLQPSSKAKATVRETDFDWGKINYSGEKPTKTFTIKNTGTDTLKLFNVRTSCHCTKAHITIDGVSSPDFGMVGTSSWVGDVRPGKEAKVVIVFDQAFHGDQGLGPVVRYTMVETNDPSNSKITFATSGTVVKD